MKTVHEVSELTGVSIRTLQHYDNIGLLHPSKRTKAGYRLYSEEDLGRLQQILLFRELEFPLKEIKGIVASPNFDQTRALEQQIELLELKRQRMGKLIELARSLMAKGERIMSFEAFDTSKIDEYAQQAKASWGDTREWKEFEVKSASRSAQDEKALGNDLLALFEPFARMAAEGLDPASDAAQAQARTVQDFISAHYYQCSDEVFKQLGVVYGSGGDFTRNINAAAGEGAAEFASRAIAAL